MGHHILIVEDDPQIAESLTDMLEILDHEVVGVAENDLGFDLFLQLGLVYAFDRAEGTHGHENGGIDLAVLRIDRNNAGVRFLVGVVEGKLHWCEGSHVVK